jgi:hypothetical protein
MANRGKPKNNPTPYNAGDVIMFLRDIKKDNWASGIKEVVIPKNIPVTIDKINKSHVWVKYKGEVHWLRTQLDRMVPATEAAIVLFGDKNASKADNQK